MKKLTLFLIGYRGAGKSTVGQALAEELHLPLYSLDKILETREGRTIPQIVEEQGWPYFRDLEALLLQEFASESGVIDCGGGVIEREENRALLKRQDWVFFLKASVGEVQTRLQDKADRPSLTGTEDFLSEVQKVYSRRMPLYEESAKYILNADQNSIETAREILKILNKKD